MATPQKPRMGKATWVEIRATCDELKIKLDEVSDEIQIRQINEDKLRGARSRYPTLDARLAASENAGASGEISWRLLNTPAPELKTLLPPAGKESE